jgi:hypothetical protein
MDVDQNIDVPQLLHMTIQSKQGDTAMLAAAVCTVIRTLYTRIVLV